MGNSSEVTVVRSSALTDKGWFVLPCSMYRGGTSKAVFLRQDDLPEDPHLRDAVILTLFGSPDPRQVDGLGGADPLTSKLAILSPSTRADADVEFTFGQVSLTETHVDYRGTCGNISSAVGAFAIDQGWVQAVEPTTSVRVWNANSGRLLVVETPVHAGRSALTGTCRIAGVPGLGPCVRLDFGDISGSVTGALLPTGRARESVWVNGVGDVLVSIVDAGSACVFVRAESVGIPASTMPVQLEDHPTWLSTLEAIRGYIAYHLRLVSDSRRAAQESPAVPKLLMIGPAQTYTDSSGREVNANDIDLLGRALTNQRPHQAYPVTGAIATATAALIPDTIVNETVGHRPTGPLRIGHPSGVMTADVAVLEQEDGRHLSHAIVERTARELMRGEAFVPWSKVLVLKERLQRQEVSHA